MEVEYTPGYNPPVGVVAYRNPNVIITKATPVDFETTLSGSQRGLVDVLEQQHPVYKENYLNWIDWYNWYTGENITSYIYRHVREHESHYRARQERAYYFNYVDSIISLIGSFLFSRAITRSFHREHQGDEIESYEETSFWTDIDLKGTNINDFMRRVFTFTKIFGYVDVVVDMPHTDEEITSELQRLSLNMRPYCYIILPHQMINWEVDEFGDFLWVRWKENANRLENPFQMRSPVQIIRYTTWTRNEWFIHEVRKEYAGEETVTLVNAGRHNLGIVPVVRFYGKKDLICETMGRSLVASIGKINIEILNISSLIDSEMFAKCLNLLVMKDPEGEDLSNRNDPSRGVEIGSNNVLFYTGDTPPHYIAPASDPGMFMIEWIGKCIDEIYRIATLGNDVGVDQTKSGVAYSYEFNMTNRMLADNADLMQEGEERMHMLYARWKGQQYDGYVDYPDSFDVGSYRDELSSLLDAKKLFRSPTLIRELEKKIGRKMLARSSANVADKIMEEIDTLPEKGIMEENDGSTRRKGDPTNPQQLERERQNREDKVLSPVYK